MESDHTTDTELERTKNFLKNAEATIERIKSFGAVSHLGHEVTILNQRRTLRQLSESLWRRKQAARRLRERVKQLEDHIKSTNAGVAWLADQREKQQHERLVRD